jgi:hypothetical protein
MRTVAQELDVVVRFTVGRAAGVGMAVRGEVRSRYGSQSFWGWLELLGQLEALVDRAAGDLDADSAADADRGTDIDPGGGAAGAGGGGR